MPTLIEVPINASMSADSNDNEQETRGQRDEETFMNESTRMFDETILGNESTDRSQHNQIVAPFDEDSRVGGFSYGENDETRLGDVTELNDETRLGADATTLNNDDTVLNIARQTLSEKDAVLQYEKPEPAKRTTGPKEEHYTRHFESYVSHVITDFQRQHPGKLKNYCSMSQSEKQREQSRVNALLARLGGTTTDVLKCRAHDAGGPVALAETSGESSATRLSLDHNNSFTDESNRENPGLSPPPANDSFASASSRENEDAEMFSECNQSSNLLSPESEVDELAARMDQSMGLMSPAPDVGTSPVGPPQRSPPPVAMAEDDDSSEASSVELVRRTESARSTPSSQMYESPTITTNRSKRMASASGKRGTDQSRMRLDDDSFASFDASIVRPSEMIASPSQLLRSSHTSPESPLFQASQSPIDDAFSSAEKNRVQVQSAGRRLEVFEDHQSPNNDDTLQSHDVTANYRRKVRWNEESFLQEIPANVHLKEGAPFRMKPLRVGRPTRQEAEDSGRRRQVAMASMPDPLRHYEGALRKKVKAAYAWMKERDILSEEDDDEVNGGLLFSMNVEQIIDVTMKLCIKHQSEHNQRDIGEDEALNGGALIVARSKEDLQDWESSLRECTCFSVLNHSTMTVEDRKRKATANRCAGYDVVLTTFDAIKSKDIATPLDSKGHAIIHEKVGVQDGWFSSRSSGSQPAGRVEQLSVLHQINWRRILFLDVLGRKSFVAKLKTARADAAVAIGASSR
jgi:hypothetical protein